MKIFTRRFRLTAANASFNIGVFISIFTNIFFNNTTPTAKLELILQLTYIISHASPTIKHFTVAVNTKPILMHCY
jgi:hypothetical protein